jgi:hypothetical protein
MKYRSNDDQYREDAKNHGIEIAARLYALRETGWLDVDGCTVVKVQCGQCYTWYDEELETALAKVVSNAEYLCIKCDDNAKMSSGVTAFLPSVFTGWQMP